MKDMIIPEGWEKKVASSLFNIQGGNAFKSTDRTDCGVRWLKIANVGFGKIKWEDESFLPYEYINKYKAFNLNPEDVVVALTRPLLNGKLKISKLDFSDSPCLLNQRVGRIQPHKDADSTFLFQLLMSKNIANQVEATLLGTDPPNLSMKTFETIPILLPPLPEQKAIADLLGTWDEAVEKTEKLIRAKEKQFKYLLRKLIGDGEKKGWEKVKLGEVGKIRTGKKDANAMNNSGQYRFYTCAKNYYYIEDYSFDTEALIVSGNGANVGYIHYFRGKFDAYQRTYVIDNFSSEIDIHFLHSYLQKKLKRRIDKEKSESNTPYIRLSTLTEMPIEVPPIEDQRRIAEVLSLAGEEIDLLKKIAEKYKLQKRGLMQVLLSGRKRIRESVVEEYV